MIFSLDLGLEPSEDALWLRQSTVGSWELCPGRVMLSEAEGFNDLPSEAMSWGTLVHEIIAIDLLHGETPWTVGNVVDLWDKLVNDEYGVSLAELAHPEMADLWAEEAIGAYRLWLRDVKPTLPEGERLVEQKLEAPLGILPSGREVWLHGTGDLLYVDGNPGYDWKTAGRGWKATKAAGIGQPSAYTYLAQYNHDVFIPEWKYWVYNRQAVRWDLHQTTRTPAQVTAWLRHAWGIAVAIDSGATYYTPWQDTFGDMKRGWWCSPKFCGAWDVCPGKGVVGDGIESEKGLVTWV